MATNKSQIDAMFIGVKQYFTKGKHVVKNYGDQRIHSVFFC